MLLSCFIWPIYIYIYIYAQYHLVAIHRTENWIYYVMCCSMISDFDPLPDVNDCTPGVCLNQGTCVDGVNSFQCICAEGWEGQFCGISKSNFCCWLRKTWFKSAHRFSPFQASIWEVHSSLFDMQKSNEYECNPKTSFIFFSTSMLVVYVGLYYYITL